MVLHVAISEHPEPAVDRLAEHLEFAVDDPMAPLWVAVPTSGMQRWLTLQLARRLGTSEGRCDGITANIDMPFPGALVGRILDADRVAAVEGGSELDAGPDPWQPDALALTLLEVVRQRPDDPELGPLARTGGGGGDRVEGADVAGGLSFAHARHVADLFDRYGVHRPDMVRNWSFGNDAGPDGAALTETLRWQPRLWRQLRAHIGEASPAERLPSALERIASGELDPLLPDSLFAFGLTGFPGGIAYLRVLGAMASRHNIHLFNVTPSIAFTKVLVGAAADLYLSLREGDPIPAVPPALENLDLHPLLRTWATPAAGTAAVLGWAQSESRGQIAPLEVISHQRPTDTAKPANGDDTGESEPLEPLSVANGPTLLTALHGDISANRPPRGRHRLAPDDRSVQIHSCPGPMRQVEVLRDALLHALADDPTLSEDDIVVLCPALADFEPLLDAGLGPSIDRRTRRDGGPPQLRYRIGDRSLSRISPLAEAVDALLELVGGRCAASEVLSFLSRDPVRRRFHFDDDDIATITSWVQTTGTRWGLDAEHRTRWQVPVDVTTNTWRAMLDQLLVGLAVAESDFARAPGDIAPHNTDGSIDLIGRLSEAVTAIAALERQVREPMALGRWLDLVDGTIDRFFRLDWDDLGQAESLRRSLSDLADRLPPLNAQGGLQGPAALELELADIRRVLHDTLGAQPGRTNFFSGGITITSLIPLRGVPHRVVALLGFDEEALTKRQVHGDDLVAQFPQIGDRDARADERQALLETVLMARDALIVTRNGHNLRTNQPVPAAVPLAELTDALRLTLDPDDRARFASQVEVVHPRHGFELANFRAGVAHPRQPWSFDRSARDGARAQVGRAATATSAASNPLRQPLPPLERRVIEVAELRRFLAHAPSAFASVRLGLGSLREPAKLADQLPATIDGLEGWSLGTTMLDIERHQGLDEASDSGDHRDGAERNRWEQVVRARGQLPPGTLGTKRLADLDQKVASLLTAAAARDADGPIGVDHQIDLTLANDFRIVGAVTDCRSHRCLPGPVRVTYTTYNPKMALDGWLDVVLLTLTDPSVLWCATIISRKDRSFQAHRLVVAGTTAEERYDQAHRGAQTLAELWAEGMTVPLPLTPKTSRSLSLGHFGKARSDWVRDGDGFPTEREKGAGAAIFGDTDLDELLAEDIAEVGPAQIGVVSEQLWRLVLDSSVDVDGTLEGATVGSPELLDLIAELEADTSALSASETREAAGSRNKR